MDDIGIGSFLLNLALIGGGLIFVLGLLISKFIFKFNWLLSASIGVIIAIIGFFLAPYAFFFFLKLSGIS